MRTKLVEIRKKAGFSQYTLAATIGISRSHYAQIESGDKNPSLDLAMRIKRVLLYKGDDIFFDKKRPDTGSQKK